MSEPSRLLAALRRTADVLDERHVSWALVGGLAVSTRAEPRFTRDIDVAVAVANDASAEAVVSAFVAAGYGILLTLEHHALGRLATVRLRPPAEPPEGIVLDLLFASSGIEPEICRDAERLEFPGGFHVPVARAGHLVAMKLLAAESDRPQDAVDLEALRLDLTDEECERARAAIVTIERIGANRGKLLIDDFNAWLGRKRAEHQE